MVVDSVSVSESDDARRRGEGKGREGRGAEEWDATHLAEQIPVLETHSAHDLADDLQLRHGFRRTRELEKVPLRLLPLRVRFAESKTANGRACASDDAANGQTRAKGTSADESRAVRGAEMCACR